MKDYIVWYKESESSPDIVRGMARNYKRAEDMAHYLYLDRASRKIPVFSTGVTRMYHGEIYSDDECSMRWSVIILGEDVRDN
jgi:hypothetical protein